MKSRIISEGIIRAIIIVIISVLALYFFILVKSVLIYISISAALALIGNPLSQFLHVKLRLPKTLSVIFTVLLFIGIIAGLIVIFIPLILSQGENLALLNTKDLEKNILTLFNQINTYLLEYNIDIIDKIKQLNIVKNIQIIPSIFNYIISALGSLWIGMFSILFITFFLLRDKNILDKSIYLLVNDKYELRVKKSLSVIQKLLSRYFIGLVCQISILFILYTVSLFIFGVDNALVIAFICALLNLVPYLGPIIGGVFMVSITMISKLELSFQHEILPTAAYVFTSYLILQLIDNFLIQPLIFSNSVKSHPLEIFLIILIGGSLFGVIGMILAVPLYTVIKVILKEFLYENKIVKYLTKRI